MLNAVCPYLHVARESEALGPFYNASSAIVIPHLSPARMWLSRLRWCPFHAHIASVATLFTAPVVLPAPLGPFYNASSAIVIPHHSPARMWFSRPRWCPSRIAPVATIFTAPVVPPALCLCGSTCTYIYWSKHAKLLKAMLNAVCPYLHVARESEALGPFYNASSAIVIPHLSPARMWLSRLRWCPFHAHIAPVATLFTAPVVLPAPLGPFYNASSAIVIPHHSAARIWFSRPRWCPSRIAPVATIFTAPVVPPALCFCGSTCTYIYWSKHANC